MKPYETEQRKLLIALFRNDPDRFYTVDEVVEILRGDSEEDNACSVSTVYRLISRLCEDGVVHKHARDGSRKFYYQYVKGKECAQHLHLKCDACGKLIHMTGGTSERLLCEVLKENGFAVDGARAIMPGICEGCRRLKEQAAVSSTRGDV